MQLGQERDQVLQGPAKSVNRPSHDDVELAPGRALAQSVESGPPISTLGAADALVAIDVDDLAAHPVGDLAERALLVLGRLPIQRTDADVESGAAHGDSPGTRRMPHPEDGRACTKINWFACAKWSDRKPLILRDLAAASAREFSVHPAFSPEQLAATRPKAITLGSNSIGSREYLDGVGRIDNRHEEA